MSPDRTTPQRLAMIVADGKLLQATGVFQIGEPAFQDEPQEVGPRPIRNFQPRPPPSIEHLSFPNKATDYRDQAENMFGDATSSKNPHEQNLALAKRAQANDCLMSEMLFYVGLFHEKLWNNTGITAQQRQTWAVESFPHELMPSCVLERARFARNRVEHQFTNTNEKELTQCREAMHIFFEIMNLYWWAFFNDSCFIFNNGTVQIARYDGLLLVCDRHLPNPVVEHTNANSDLGFRFIRKLLYELRSRCGTILLTEG